MFKYQGPSANFRQALEEYGQRLEALYRQVLGREQFDAVTRFVSPRLYITSKPGQAVIKSIVPDLEALFRGSRNPAFLFNAFNLVDLDETLTRELDRRILHELGYDPSAWLKSKSDDEIPDHFRRRDDSRQRYFQGMSWDYLVKAIAEWHKLLNPNNQSMLNLINSYQQYRIRKIPTEQITDLEARLASAISSGFGFEMDNFAGILTLSPPAEKAQVDDDGRLRLIDSSAIRISPIIVLSEEGVERYTKTQLAESDLPPYLVAFIHEFHHFIGICLQRYPIGLTTGLMLRKGKEQKKG